MSWLTGKQVHILKHSDVLDNQSLDGQMSYDAWQRVESTTFDWLVSMPLAAVELRRYMNHHFKEEIVI